VNTAALLALPGDAVEAQAGQQRDATTGTRITYSPKVFIPLTMLCRDRCGYCTFARPPARSQSPYLSPEEVLAVARRGAAAGCHEALFTLGERPEERYGAARDWLADHGHASTVDYLAAMCRLVLDETGLLPHANAGALFADELAALRAVTASQGMMLESLNRDLACHRGCPDKTPERRLATLEAAGRLAIPFTTGILVGIGESRADRVAALSAIAATHRRYGHIQEVIVQNFLPKPDTALRHSPPCPPDEFLDAIALARLILPPDVHVQAPPVELRQRFDAPPINVFVVRSPLPEAHAYGFRAPYVVVLHSALLDSLDADELRYALGRQVGRIRFGHTRVALLLGGGQSTLPSILGWAGWLRDVLFAWYWRMQVVTADRCGVLACAGTGGRGSGPRSSCRLVQLSWTRCAPMTFSDRSTS
jgi:7,8-didemethyl-8-hydroxy-5-deazariboflavin synthase CofG subunit